MLVSALLELKARALFPDEAAELAELEPEEAAEELARRLAEYRRMKEAATWLAERLAGERDRFFRVGPAPLAPQPERKLAAQDPQQLAATLRLLAEPPPQVSLAHMQLTFPPVARFLERLRKTGEIALEQAAPFSPIRVSRPAARPWSATAPAGQSPAPPTPQERADEPGQETERPSERNSEWIARSA